MDSRQTILFAEDSENDVMLIQRGFEMARFPVDLRFVENGALAVEYLSGKNQYSDRDKFPIPSVLLTDLQMPRMGGFELLTWLRSQKQWRKLPVIVVTGSDQAADAQRAMNLGANAYVVKELLMRPPPSLFESILRFVNPVRAGIRETWSKRMQRSGAR
jgi:CheY-like chemotaxis protein